MKRFKMKKILDSFFVYFKQCVTSRCNVLLSLISNFNKITKSQKDKIIYERETHLTKINAVGILHKYDY